MAARTETTPSPAKASVASWLSLAVLLIATLYTYADRQIFALQAEPLRKALELSDLQFGLLQGLGHAILAAIVGYPIAWLSDRFDRRVVLAGCLAVWSATVMASGFAGSFLQLFLATSLVGAAEAGMLPILYALVPELFSGKQRQYANSALVVAGRLLVGLVIAACGWLIFAIDQWRPAMPEALRSMETWRVAFLLTGATGLIFVPAVLLVRMSTDRPSVARAADAATNAPVWPFLSGQVATFASFMISVGLLVFGAVVLVSRWWRAGSTATGCDRPLEDPAGDPDAAERLSVAAPAGLPAGVALAAQWLATAWLWSQWLIQDLANLFIYLPRQPGAGLLALALAVLCAGVCLLLVESGGAIQAIVRRKSGLQEPLASAGLSFVYGLILALLALWGREPLSTTWVFLGLLAGRELALLLTPMARPVAELALDLGRDLALAALGLAVSLAVALAVQPLRGVG